MTPSGRSVETLNDLISRLEKASGPDEDLDFAISREISGNHIVKYSSAHMDYTSSLDAALTLVPEHLHLLNLRNMNDTTWFAGLAHRFAEYELDNDFEAESKTPAIALCIAALKARAIEQADSLSREEG